MKRPSRFHIAPISGGINSRAVQQGMDSSNRVIQDILDKDILNGRPIKEQTLAVGSVNKISHNLGRRYKGFFITNLTAPVVIYATAATSPDRELWLSCSALDATTSLTVDIWVY